MTSTLSPRATVSAHDAGLATSRTWRTTKSAIMTVLMGGALLVVMIPLGLVIFVVIQKGASALSWAFITEDIPVRAREVGPGMGPAIVGTLIITFVATLIAVPLGILGAVYLNEYGQTRPFPKPDRPMDMKDLKVIALVQNDKTKEIVQAVQIEVEGRVAGTP